MSIGGRDGAGSSAIADIVADASRALAQMIDLMALFIAASCLGKGIP
ncbi:hypothetical protein [Mesorhizobium sp. M7A.F.Ca.ET.027.03.2.1]|nr:hypothetical protein [Mesorhizobium sp. M7A.F.Ca.ET.027.03.2.1]